MEPYKELERKEILKERETVQVPPPTIEEDIIEKIISGQVPTTQAEPVTSTELTAEKAGPGVNNIILWLMGAVALYLILKK